MAADGQLTTIEPRPVSVGPSYDQIKEMAHYFAKSNMFGVSTPEQAFSLLMIAQAEGLHPARALQEYHVIKNKPTLKAEAMLGRFQRAGGKVKWITHTDTEVTAEFTHEASGTTSVSWDMARAKTAGVTGNDTWRKYPRQMLRARVISEGVRLSYPACILGFYTPEEVSDFDDRRDVPARHISPPVPAQSPDAPAEVIEGQILPRVDVSPLDAGTGTNRDWKDLHASLKRALENCSTMEAMCEWEKAWEDELNTMPEDYWADLKGIFDRKAAAIEAMKI